MARFGPYTELQSAEVSHITQVDAVARASVIKDVAYHWNLVLPKGDKFYGHVAIDFESSVPSPQIWLDFTGDLIYYFTINGTHQEPQWAKSHLHLPGLVAGHNSVEVKYRNNYAHDGLGMHHFKDIADDEEYVYTQFEAPSAHLAFPCFDQPDLKATLDLSVVAPEAWKVIANEPSSVETFKRSTDIVYQELPAGEYKLHVFNQTKRISTYLFAVCAGPYEGWRLEENAAHVPLGLYCRKSLAKYCNSERIFRWTVNGFLFYSKFFGVPYPFSKYDQVYVPEFKYGAMENVGCVTYRDEYIFRDEPSQMQLSGVCNTFLHEMAHMWFGNLVTMKWWDDLWLNESFATYISTVCQGTQLPTEFPNVWNEFLADKGWGYSTDQLSTTHPICTIVNHTGETETNFDGISYSKGSSILKQLHFILGDAVFTSSLQEYIQTNQYGNTVFNDLISTISKHAKAANIPIDIEGWSDLWVKTAGLNQLKASFEAKDGVLTRFAIEQEAVLPAHPTLRPHKILVEFYASDMSVSWRGALIVQPQAETVYPQFVGKPTPSCIILNAEDHDFAKIVVDTKSLEFLQGHLKAIPSSLTKQVTLRAIWDMVRDARYSAVEFVDLVVNFIQDETDLTICHYLLELSVSAIRYYIPGGMAMKYYSNKIFEVTLGRIKRATNQDEVIIFQKKLLQFLHHPMDIISARDWVVNNDTGIPLLKLGQNDRWGILAAYSSISTQAKKLVEAELVKDKTSTGRNFFLLCSGAYPDPVSKAQVWKELTTNTGKYSNYELHYYTAGFNSASQVWLYHPYFSLYSDSILHVLATADKELSRILSESLLPAFAGKEDVIQLIDAHLPKVPEDRVDVTRALKEERDDLERTSKGCELSYRRIYQLS